MKSEDSVRDTLRTFTRALERSDMDTVTRLFANDGVLVYYGTHNKLHMTNWPEVEASFKQQFSVLQDLKCSIDDEIRVRLLSGGTVACAATEAFSLSGKLGGEPFVTSGSRCTWTLELVDGSWRFVQMHLSVSDPGALGKRCMALIEDRFGAEACISNNN